MIQPRYSRLSSHSSSPMFRRNVATGRGFGGSSLKLNQSPELVFSIVSNSVSISEYKILDCETKTSLFVIEAGKIILVAIWFWCLIGANFCFDGLNTILNYGTQDL